MKTLELKKTKGKNIDKLVQEYRNKYPYLIRIIVK